MGNFSLGSFLAAVAVLLAWPSFLRGAEPAAGSNAQHAAKFVRLALQTELAGPSPERQALLDKAIESDRGFAAARWQAGFVWSGGHWRTIDEAIAIAAKSRSLAEYARWRDQLVDTADNQRRLARWCAAHHLREEAQYHWLQVLKFGPAADALDALGLKLYGGRMLTREQIARLQDEAETRRQALALWQPRIESWRDAIVDNTLDATQARAELLAIRDEQAVPALVAALWKGSANQDIHQLYIGVVSQVAGDEATEALLHAAMASTSDTVHEAAVDALKQRPLYAVVPRLIARLQAPFDTDCQIYLLADGTIRVEHTLHVRAATEDRYGHQTRTYQASGSNNPGQVAWRLRQASRYVQRAEAQMQGRALSNAARNAPIQDILANVMQLEPVDDPQVWYQRWLDYSEQYADPAARGSYHNYSSSHIQSCFPAGTPVTTLTGPRPIEQIRPGDRVLSQDVETGCLDFKLVQGVTYRPPAPLVRIAAGGHAIDATRGHPFWVNGHGWQYAKHLEAGIVLHAAHGAVAIDSVGEAPPAPAYNLIVSEYNAYFAGDAQLLVHDNLPLAETAAIVPGLLAVEASPP